MVSQIEGFLYSLMSGYDEHVYTPLQTNLSPIIEKIPRYVNIANRKMSVFTANNVTFARTFLIIPIAWFLKYDHCLLAALMVVLHDFLDHVDGIVAKVHKKKFPGQDDPLLGGFLDAFCDKIVNVFSLWTVIQMMSFDELHKVQLFIYVGVCYTVMAYETVIGIVRVQDYFEAKYKQVIKTDDEKIETETSSSNNSSAQVTQASMEGKLKEKLESMGVAFLCLGLSRTMFKFLTGVSILFGLVCLLLTVRMAHKSLMSKLKARNSRDLSE